MIKFFNWYGGKIRCLAELLSLIPYDCTEWYELCCGSGVVTLNKARWEIEVINDLDPEIYNLFQVMSDRTKGKILLDRLLKLKYSKDVFSKAKAAKKNQFSGMDEIEKAEMSFILISQSFNAIRKSWRKGVSQEEYSWKLKTQLPDVYDRLQGVTVWNRDCIEVLEEIKENENACVFLDVPYRPSMRGAKKVYECEMSEEAHKKLLITIRDSKNKIILCGYREKNGQDLYDQYLLPYKWNHYKVAELVKSCQVKEKKDKSEEWIWVNYELPEFSRFMIDHGTAEE